MPLTRNPEPGTRNPGTGTVLAFDFGEKRIGVAVGDTALGVAHPVTTIHAGSNEQRLAAVAALVAEWQPALLVVGLPLHPDAAEHEMTRAARRFANRLRERFRLETVLVDERYTSTAADQALREAGTGSGRRQRALDPLAAQYILQAWFDEHPRAA
ncbi:MAG TPA: Holliday junction resolvase RuvX [Burkholderiales bacterium]|nr:Holliday junction resolvase RuvX [Burkholderiales bacterium]